MRDIFCPNCLVTLLNNADDVTRAKCKIFRVAVVVVVVKQNSFFCQLEKAFEWHLLKGLISQQCLHCLHKEQVVGG